MEKPNLYIPPNKIIKKSVAVWLILASEKKVLLQKRAAVENGKSQSFVGLCQPTWNGKVEDGEELKDAIKREAEEELGKPFGDTFDFSSLRLFDENEYSFGEKQFIGYNYWGVVDAIQLAMVNLHNGAELEFLKIGVADFPRVKVYSKDAVVSGKEVALFQDQYQALKKLFSLKEVIEITS